MKQVEPDAMIMERLNYVRKENANFIFGKINPADYFQSEKCSLFTFPSISSIIARDNIRKRAKEM